MQKVFQTKEHGTYKEYELLKAKEKFKTDIFSHNNKKRKLIFKVYYKPSGNWLAHLYV